jgi:DNA primase
MQSNNAARNETQRPPILEVIEQHVDLRKVGREYWGLCPFHAEKTPSFAVNPEKEVFYCHSCQAGGDVIRFIEKIEGIDFKAAVKKLGLEAYRPSPAQLQVKRDAKTIALWVRTTSNKICDALREIGDEIRVCKLAREQLPVADPAVEEARKRALAKHEADLIRQWAILTDLDDDLNNPKTALELWRQRADIDGLVESLA